MLPVISPVSEEPCLSRIPLLVPSPWLSAPPPCPGMSCLESHCPPRKSQGSCLPQNALLLCPGKDVAHKYALCPLLRMKCLQKHICLRHDMAETFRACLGLVYTCYTERLAGPGGEPVRLETLVRNHICCLYSA